MSKKTIYFKKIHKLFISSIVLHNSFHFFYTSKLNADSETINSTTVIQPNKNIDVVTIDLLENGKESIDSDVNLLLYVVEHNVKHLRAKIQFDLSREKIMSPNSSEVFKKVIKEGGGLLQGFIQYKFVSMISQEINEQKYKQLMGKKNEILLSEKSMQMDQEYKRILQIIDEKDNVIKVMEDHIDKLTKEAKKMTINLQNQSLSKDAKSPISLNINVKPSNKIQLQHRKLTKENQTLKAKMFKMSEIIEKLRDQKIISEREIQTMKELVSPGKSSSGKDKISDEKPSIIQLLEAQSSKSDKGLEPRWLKDHVVSSYSEVRKRLSNQDQLLKLQIQNASKFEDISADKGVLLTKLKGSVVQIELLQKEVEQLRVYIKKLTDQLKILRKNNSKEGIMAKIEAIRSENQRAIQDLKNEGRLTLETELFAHEKSKWMIEIEILKKDLEDLQIKSDHLTSQLKVKEQEYTTKEHKYQTREIQLSKERDIYKTQLDQAKKNLQDMLKKNVPYENIGMATSELAKSYVNLSKEKNEITERIQTQKAQLQKAKSRNSKVQGEIKMRASEVEELRRYQSLNKTIAQKLEQSKREIQKYQKKYNDLRNYVKTIQSTLKNKGKYESQEKYQEDIFDKLKKFEQMTQKAEQELFNEEIQSCKKERDQILDEFYNGVVAMKKEVDTNPSLSTEEKRLLKQKKEGEMKKEKDQKVKEIEKKINLISGKQEQWKKVFIQRTKSVPERLASLQKMLMQSDPKKILKDTVDLKDIKGSAPAANKLVDSIIMREDSNNSIQKMKESKEILKNSEVLMKASSSLQEMRAKYFQQWTKMNEATRNQMKVTMQQNNKLRLNITDLTSKLEKQRIEKDRQINNLVRQWKQKQNKNQISNMANSKQKTNLEKKIENLTKENTNLKEILKEHENSIDALEKQLTNTNEELNKKIMYNGELQTRNKSLLDELTEYEKAAKKLIEEIEHLNDINKQNKNQFDRLLEERSNAFVHIENIRKSEIEKLKRIKDQLQFRIETEINDSIRVKGENSQLFNQNDHLTSQNKEYEESLQMLRESHLKEIAELGQKLKIYEDINLQLQKNLMSLAEDYNKLQQQKVTMQIEREAKQKELSTYQHLSEQLKNIEQKFKEEKKDLQYIVSDKKQQLKKMETDYLIFQEKVKMISEDNDKIRTDIEKKDQTIDSLREKLNQKALEVIKIAEEKSIASIEKVQITKQIQALQLQTSKLKEEIIELRSQNFDLKEKLRLSSQERELSAPTPPESLTPMDQSRLKQDLMIKPTQMSRALTSKILKSDQSSPPPEENVLDNKDQIKIIKQQTHRPENLITVNDLSDGEDARSEKSRVSRVSRMSRRSARSHNKKSEKLDPFYMTHSPPEILEKKSLSYDREVELMKEISDLYAEKNDLLKQIQQMTIEIEQLKVQCQQKGVKPAEKVEKKKTIKIDDESIELNTLEGTISQDNQKTIEESANLNRTVRSYQTDYSQQMKNLELMIEDLEKDKELLNKALEQEKTNNEKLLMVEDEINKLHHDYTEKIEEMSREFQEKISQFASAKHDYEQKIESILGELMEKDQKLSQALQQLQQTHDKILLLEQQLSKFQVQSQEKDRNIQLFQQKINKMKIQYRKYEEEAELQILTLREKFEEVVGYNKEKDNQLVEMGQKYLNLEDGAQHQYEEMKKIEDLLQKQTKAKERLQQDNKKVLEEREEFDMARKKLLKKIHELEVQLVGKHEEIGEANKNASLAITKSNIKIQNMESELKDMRRRQEEKDKVVTTLKNEIAHYNEECLVLKKANEDLDYELQKVTKELKDIVVHYETEFKEINKNKLSFAETLKKSDFLLKDKEKVLVQLRNELRQNQRQRMKAENELQELKGVYQRFKLTKQKEFNDKCNDYQFKNNEYELIKTAYEKLVQENFLNEAKIQEEKEKYNRLFNDYKIKMANYEEALEDLSKEFTALANGPTKEQLEQTLFENQLFRNKIKELEEDAKKSRFKNSSAQETLQMEFKKYKTNKEALILNLEAELESYSSKVNELEEDNFYLKRESENMRNQMQSLSDDKYELEEEVNLLRDDIDELKEEVEFYKAKRRQGLTKLLNDTEG